MRNIYRLLTIIVTLFLVGCGSALPTVKPFKIDIQQGNVVTSEMLLKLRPGMTKSQVKFIMGTPLLIDSFRSNRWDYFYQLRKDGKIVKQHRVILDFENDLLKRVRGDVVPKGQTVEDVTKKLKEEAEAKKAQEETKAPDAPVDAEPKVVPIETPAAEVTDQMAPESTEAEDSVEADTPPSVIAVPPVAAPLAQEPSLSPAVPATIEPDNVAPEQAIEAVEKQAEPAETVEAAQPTAPEQIEETVKTESVEKVKEVAPQVQEPVEAAADNAMSHSQVPKGKDMRVFRLDRSLDTSRIRVPTENVQPKAIDSAVTEAVEAAKEVPVEEEPSFVERMLEKIGF